MPLDYVILMCGVLLAGLYPALLIISVVSKWALIGRYQPGKYPVWGLYYWRWWLVTRIQALSGAGFLAGTPLMSVYYRLMGATVGKHCILDTSLCQAFDLVAIGDDTSIGAQTQLLGCRVEDGMLVVGGIDIGSRCFVGIHSAIGLNTRIGDDSQLDDLSLLPDGVVMNAAESRRGSPAQPASVEVPQPPEGKAARRYPVLFGLLHLLVIYVGQIFLLLTALPSLALVIYAIYKWGLLWGFASALIAGPLGIISFCLGVAVVKAIVLGKVKPGVYRLESGFYLRKWFIDGLLNISRRLLLPLYATLYLPPWLRLLGAKLGARMEISTVSHISPDLLVADDESFFADAALIGGMRIFRGYIQIGVNRIGRRSFVGNSAMMPVGTELGNDCLLGCLSAPPASKQKVPDESAWLGSPSFQLPHRQKLIGFDDSVLYKPSTSLYIKRLIIDALRILVPSIVSTVSTIALFAALYATYIYMGLPALLGLTPLITLGLAVGAALSVVVIKKVLMGEYKPTVKPLWSMFVWLNELINGSYESVAAPALAPMLGTPFYAAYMRRLGCKIGRGVYLGTSLFSEFDLVEIGDYAAVNLGATIQTHLFEDRIMKASYLKIGNECSVGNMAVILYDTEMQTGSKVGPLSLLMKGETVPASSRWHGIPTGPNNA
jgi:non-ribosomal peptide synthetase-like protein